MKFFLGDPHFSHKNIIEWARPQFSNIKMHDQFLVNSFIEWSTILHEEDELWVLGDWGNTEFLYLMNNFKCKTIFMFGNHDKHTDITLFKQYFDIIYEYPIYINDKICISHIPQNVFDDQINVYAHLHNNIIDKPNYISTCLEINNFKLVSFKYITNRFSQLPKYNRRFLQAPFTDWEKVIARPQQDLILKPDGHIDISAQRAKIAFEKEYKELLGDKFKW